MRLASIASLLVVVAVAACSPGKSSEDSEIVEVQNTVAMASSIDDAFYRAPCELDVQLVGLYYGNPAQQKFVDRTKNACEQKEYGTPAFTRKVSFVATNRVAPNAFCVITTDSVYSTHGASATNRQVLVVRPMESSVWRVVREGDFNLNDPPSCRGL